jgi:glycosyltransferase involved in cell wall biosynthesis
VSPAATSGGPELSIVVPVYNEEDNVAPLVEAVRTALGDGPAWELVLVDDGSRDGTAARVLEIQRREPRVRLIRLARNYGQTPAMQAGFDHARGRLVVSLDGDLQNDPADIPRIVAKLDEGYDLVAGYRERRQDRLLTRKIPSWLANRIIRGITGVDIRDNGCSLKGYRREVLDRLHLYSDMHRFIPAVAATTAGARIAEIPVRHHARRFGKSKYGLTRIAKVLADLLTILMIRSFRERPLALFATGAGAALGLAALFEAAALTAPRAHGDGPSVTLVLPGVALLWLGLAIYLLMLGLIGQIALHEGRALAAGELPLARERPR